MSVSEDEFTALRAVLMLSAVLTVSRCQTQHLLVIGQYITEMTVN